MLIDILQMFVGTLLRVYEVLFILRAILSWFPMMQTGELMNVLYSLTEPVLAPIRSVLMRISFLQNLPIDFSVLVAFLLIDVIRTVILTI